MTNHSRTTLFSVPNTTSKDALDGTATPEEKTPCSSWKMTGWPAGQGHGLVLAVSHLGHSPGRPGPWACPSCESSGPLTWASSSCRRPSQGPLHLGGNNCGFVTSVTSQDVEERLPGPQATFPRRTWCQHRSGCVTG